MTAKLRLVPALPTDNRRQAGEVGARLRVIRGRRARGETHEQFARWLGCSVDAVQLWESGKRRVPGWVLVALESEAA